MFRRSGSNANRGSTGNRNKSDDGYHSASWMSQSQTLAMSLMDNEHHHIDKRMSMPDEEVDVSYNHRTVYRLVDRESKFEQAKYPIYVQRILPIEEVFKLFYAKDPVLAMTNISTLKGFMVMLIFFILSCAVTAVPWYIMGQYKSYQDECSVETTGFQRAFIFSSQVIMTIGFGTKDIFFGSCILPTVVLTIHCGVSLLVQSLIMGVIYQRLSRATSRRHTVVYSNNAVIRRIRGKLYFMLQVSELRAMQLVEAHVRLYVVRHESLHSGSDHDSRDDLSSPVPSDEDVLYTQTYAMRLSQPNDDLGGKILLSTPQIIVHEIDEHSPLRPPAEWTEERSTTAALPTRGVVPRPSLTFKGLVPNPERDSSLPRPSHSVGGQSDISSPFATAGDSGDDNSTATYSSNLRTVHVNRGHEFPVNNYQFPEIIQNKGKSTVPTSTPLVPTEEGADDVHAEKLKQKRLMDKEKDEIQRFLLDKNAEVVVVLEGVDPMTSHNVQSYHSYVSDEIKWDRFFVRCCSVIDGWTTVDFTKFHHLKKVSSNETGSMKHAPSHN